MDSASEIAALKLKIKKLEGRKLAVGEIQELKLYEEFLFNSMLEGCPRSVYTEIAGKTNKALEDLRIQYGLPIAKGKPVNVVEVIRWFHDYLKKWGRFNQQKESSETIAEDHKTRKAELDLQQSELKIKQMTADLERKIGNTISLDEVNTLFAWYESEFRKLGERLGKRFGSEAQTLFNDTLVRMSKHLENETQHGKDL